MNQDKTNVNTALEHYLKSGRQFGDGEKFYLLGFEAALHARNRCKEFDQIASEMASDLEELQRQYPRAQWKSRLRTDFSEDGNIANACVMNPTRHDPLAETVPVSFRSLFLAPSCRASTFLPSAV